MYMLFIAIMLFASPNPNICNSSQFSAAREGCLDDSRSHNQRVPKLVLKLNYDTLEYNQHSYSNHLSLDQQGCKHVLDFPLESTFLREKSPGQTYTRWATSPSAMDPRPLCVAKAFQSITTSPETRSGPAISKVCTCGCRLTTKRLLLLDNIVCIKT